MSTRTEPDTVIWWRCGVCKRDTKHEIVHSVALQNEPEGFDPLVDSRYEIVSCRGCEEHSFRYGFVLDESEGNEWTWERHPEISKDRRAAFMTAFLPKPIRSLYAETLSAYNAKALILASAGLRASVEAICKDQGFLKGNLQTKIDMMCEAGVLPKGQAEYLHQHRFLGNDAVHDMLAPPGDEFVLALEILEHLLLTLYEMPRRAKRLVKLRAERGAQVH